MSHWWAVPAWTVLGAAGAAALAPASRRLLKTTRSRYLISTTSLAPATACLCGLLAWRVGMHPELLAETCLALVAVPLAAIDLAEHRLPSALLLPAYPAIIALLGVAAILRGNPAGLLRALLGMLGVLALYLSTAVIFRSGPGAGDIRLAPLLGLVLAWRGWDCLTAGTALGLLYGTVTGLALIATGHMSWHDRFPLGPALIAGAFTAILAGIQ